MPGTGEFLKDCCDDFEDPNWSYRYNLPKSSHEQDENQRSPGGMSNNGLWHEGGKRGTPDVVKRVPTPPGGIEGSTGALMFATKNSGIPGNVQQQAAAGRPVDDVQPPAGPVDSDDLAAELHGARLSAGVGQVGKSQWSVVRHAVRLPGRNPDGTMEAYWPGMFMLFQSKTEQGRQTGSRARSRSAATVWATMSAASTSIEPGWWTLGMSFTADGQIHYYGHKGVDDLTADDSSDVELSVQHEVHRRSTTSSSTWPTGTTAGRGRRSG